jgi:transposase
MTSQHCHRCFKKWHRTDAAERRRFCSTCDHGSEKGVDRDEASTVNIAIIVLRALRGQPRPMHSCVREPSTTL